MKIIVKENNVEIGKEVASLICDLIKENPKAKLGLATGSSPIPVYQNIVKLYKENNIDFSNIVTFNLDEYVGLNEDNKNSYRYFMNDNLFKYINIKKENTFFPLINNYLTYDSLIDSYGGIDLQILGIGANGHIAFNEPGTKKDSLTHIVKLKERTILDNSRFFNNINEVPKEAITMGLGTIIKAKKIILIATGKNKSDAVKKTINSKFNEEVPASILNELDNVYFYLDRECYDNLNNY